MEADTAAVRAADAMSEFEMDKAVSSMARYVLFSQANKKIIRKEELSKRGDFRNRITKAGHNKAFPVIFNKANAYLERVFSMKLVPITEKKAWILISTLSDQSLVKKRPTDILNLIILVIVFGSNHSITHDTLLRILSEIKVDDAFLNNESFVAPSVAAYLAQMVKQNYLDREISPDYELPLYTWGKRAKLEIPLDTLTQFMTSILRLDSVSKTKLAKELSKRLQGQQFY